MGHRGTSGSQEASSRLGAVGRQPRVARCRRRVEALVAVVHEVPDGLDDQLLFPTPCSTFPEVMVGQTLSRREFLAAAGMALLGAACSRGGSTSGNSGRPGSIAALTSETPTLSILGTGGDAAPIGPGKNRFGFVLVTLQNNVLTGGTPQVWAAKDTNEKALGPWPAAWHAFTAYERTHDRSPRSPLPGDFAAQIDLPEEGNWTVAVVVQSGSKRLVGTGILPVTSEPVLAGLRTKATSTPTPVATTTSGLEAICTRTPVDRMHYISLDRALKNGKPTVVCFSTPLLCESRLCGPVTDEQILVFEKYGPGRANFIHVEEFLPGPDHTPPPATLESRSPAFKAWKLETEPWVFVIDRDGVIRFRSLGPVTAPEIDAALQSLL